MEALEDRQLLSVDPSLLAAFSASQNAENVAPTQGDAAIDLTSLASTGAGATITVDEGKFEEMTLSQSTKFAGTVDVSNAVLSTLDTHVVSTNIAASITNGYGIDQTYQGWAATLANILTYTGWSDTNVIVDSTSDDSIEQQTFEYISSSFTNANSSLYYAYAWFMGGVSDYIYQGDDNYAQVTDTTTGGLYPSTGGQWSVFDQYAREILATDIQSPLYGISAEYLDNSCGVGLEIHVADQLYEDSGTTLWGTYWGYEYDSTYDPESVNYYTAIYVSNTDGEIERVPVAWNDALGSYVLTSWQSAGYNPYIYSFTVVERMPGYGTLEPDAYEPNNSSADFDAGTAADLGVIDVVTPSSQSGSTVYGNVLTLDGLTLYAEGTDDVAADPYDYYKFELTQTASNSDSIVVKWAEGIRTQNLKATLFICNDNEAIAIDPSAFGYVDGHFDSVATQIVEHTSDANGKSYSQTYNLLTINLAGLTAGEYYLLVEFADDVVNGVNEDYSVTFNAGFDDIYEENNSFESVNSKPLSTKSAPTANLGVLYGTTELTDLVLKQYSKDIDEVDWYRFEMTGEGVNGDEINLYYNSTSSAINDADLDLYLYKLDDSDPRGYSLVDKSYAEMTNTETISLEGLPAGVYYIKVTGNYSSGNVEYKLEIKPGLNTEITDVRPEVPDGYNWESPLVVSSEEFVPNSSETYESEAVIGIDGTIYLNYAFSVNGASTEQGADATATIEGVKLGMFINGVEVDSRDLETLINNSSSLTSAQKTQLLALFCSSNGLDMEANEKVEIVNLSLGRIVEEDSFAAAYFDGSLQATNSIVIVINPDNYSFESGFGEVVDERGSQVMSLTYSNGVFYNGATPVSIEKGESLEVYRNGSYLTDVVYGYEPKNFAYRNDDIVMVSVVTHQYKVQLGSDCYTVLNPDREYVTDNNFSGVFFVVNNLSEDPFAPNASVSDVLANENDEEYSPDLGYVNLENLATVPNKDGSDDSLGRTINNLVITGAKDDNDAYISDWFRFQLKSEADGTNNYGDAYIKIDIQDDYADYGGSDNLGDLDLYLYKVVLDDEDQLFEDAYADGAYRLVLIGSSKGVNSTEQINFSDLGSAIEDGNYFIRVAGFNGAAGRYDLTVGGFTQSGDIVPTNPADYFTEDSVTILNSVATINWNIPASDYVSRVYVQYREKGATEWISISGTNGFKRSVSSCKVSGLSPDTTYEFKLSVENAFVDKEDYTATVEKTTDSFMNERVYRAVIVGVADYPGTSGDLVAAVNDAKAFRDALLEDPQWSEDNIIYLTNANATRASVINALRSIADQSDDNDVFVFYFAGSGASSVAGGRTVGYLKTYGSARSEYLSSTDLIREANNIAAGSKQFILDAGQISSQAEDTGIVYAPFVDGLTASTTNGDSDVVPQVVVLTSGTDEGDNISQVLVGSRSAFNRALVSAMEEYGQLVTAEDVENDETGELTEDDISDSRVTFAELYDSIIADDYIVSSGMTIKMASNDSEDAVLMNGLWAEKGQFDEAWLENRAIIVTTSVDSVDNYDGKISLREAAALIGTQLTETKILEAEDSFTLQAGSKVTIGVTTGTLSDDLKLVYQNGSFRTAGTCVLQTETSEVTFSRTGNIVTWLADDWTNGDVVLLDADDVQVADVEYQLVATSTVVDEATGEETSTAVTLAEGDVLYTSATGGRQVVVTKVGQNFRLMLDGSIYTRTSGLYLDGVAVTISTSAQTSTTITLNKIIFDSSVSGKKTTVNANGGPIVFANGGIVDASSTKGGVTLDGNGASALIQASGTELVSIAGLKLTNAGGSAIIVDSGATLELANSLVYGNESGDSPVFELEGTLLLVNDTIANNTTTGKLVDGSGDVSITNTIISLNTADLSNLTYDSTNVVTTDDAGFNDAAKNDYTLVKTSAACDIGRNAATKLQSGLVLEYDLAGNERVATASTVDAGAYEYTVDLADRETPSTIVTILDDIVDPTDGEISLREAIAYAGTTYQIETTLNEGDLVTADDGSVYEVRNGKLVSFDGVSAIQYGQYYAITGVYILNDAGEPTVLEDQTTVNLADGSIGTVSGDRLVNARGIKINEGAVITLADGTTGTLSYGVSTTFARNQQISVALTAASISPDTPVSAFNAGTYVLTYQQNGTFTTTLSITTTNDNNQSETTTFEASFKLVDGTEFTFVDADGELGESGVISTSRAVEIEDGKYTLLADITDSEGNVIYATGAVFTLTRGVFTDADGAEVAVARGTTFTSPSGATVEYQYSYFSNAPVSEGDSLVGEDGVTRYYKDGATLYEEIELGRSITFKKGLESGVITLDKGAISVERAITLDATLNGGLTIDAHNDSRVFTIDAYRETSASATTVINGVTLINGGSDDGGLIYVEEGSNLRLTNSTLENQTSPATAPRKGGAIYNAGRTTLESTTSKLTISGFSADDGGAIYNTGTLNVTGVEITDVVAYDGAALYNTGTATLSGATISDAEAANDGGAVYNTGTLTITRGSTITENTAENGAGVYNEGVLTVLGSSTISNNTAATNGGAIANEGSGRATLTSAKVFGNSAKYGGAIYDAAKFFATRTVFANNDASSGGSAIYTVGSATIASSLVIANGAAKPSTVISAIYAGGTDLQIVGSDVVGNSQRGVYVANGTAEIYNSILGQNNKYDVQVSGGTLNAEYSMIESVSEAISSTNLVYEPNFVSLDVTDDWSNWNLHLGSGSPAMDGGSVDFNHYDNFNGKSTTLTVDFAGNSRITESGIDVGAYASSSNQEDASTVVTTLEDIVDPTDGLISLREAIRYASTAKTVDGRTVTFSPDLFALSDSATIYLDENLQTIIIGTTVTVTSEYTNEFGQTSYRDITIDGSQSNAPLFMINGAADVEMRGLTFANGHTNAEHQSGGAFIMNGGSLTILDSTLTGNVADLHGGAISQEGGALYIIDSLLYDNEANGTYGYGGAICMTGGQAYIYNTTIAANTAGVYGGIFSLDGLVVMANSIVARNAGAQNVDVFATNFESTSNLIGAMDPWKSVGGYNGNIAGTVTNPLDPLFTDFDARDFTLDSGSLAINAGVNAYAFGPDGVRLKYDLNANERIVGGVVDMGAFESQYQDVPATVVTTLADVVDQTDGLVSLREAIEYANQFGTPITFDLGEDFDGGAEIRLDGAAGAILVTSDLVIDASNIPGGVAIIGDGSDRVFNVQGGNLKLDSVALTGGYATRGGAIYMSSGSIDLTNVLIYGNEADDEGGAIYAASGTVTALNTTIAGNTAKNVPGVYVGGSLALYNSIIAENADENSVSDENYDLYVVGKLTPVASIVGIATEQDSSRYNDYNGNFFGTEDEPVDPGFAASASYDFSLSSDSIALNAGSNRLIGLPGYYASILLTASNTTVLRTDYEGNPRLVGGTVDIGAFEYQIETESPAIVVTTLEDVVDPFDGKISLREAIDYAGSAIFEDGVTTTIGRTITFAPELAGGTITLAEPLEITKCVVVDATDLTQTLTIDAAGEGAAIILNGQADSVSDIVWLCGLTITGGVADYGAGVYHVDGAATLVNCVVYGNEGVYGAGVASVADAVLGNEDANKLTLINCTVAGNDASGAYPGLWSVGSSVNLYNTIVAKNTVNGEEAVDVAISSVGAIANSIIGAASNAVAREYGGADGNLVGTPDTPVDPAFNDVENNDYTLVRGEDGFMSPGVNGGDNAWIMLYDGSVPATDAGTNSRVIGPQVDVGAYESPLGPTEIPSLLVTTLEDVVDEYDGMISLREAVQYAHNYGLGATITFASRLSGGTIYLKESLNLSNDITIDGLTNNVQGITITTADDVLDQSIIYMNAGTAVINGVTLTGRYTERIRNGQTPAVEQGGAIYVRSGSISLYNTLIADTAAATGSAIYINPDSESAAVNLVNCTVTSNYGQTTDADAGAAVYSAKGVFNMWNTIVASNKLANGNAAQDVYKGEMQLANDTVVQRTSLNNRGVNLYDTEDVYTPEVGDVLEFANTTYPLSGYYRSVTYTEEGVYLDDYGYAYDFVDGVYIRRAQDAVITYESGNWYRDGEAYTLNMSYGDTAEWYDSSTGTTETVTYTRGFFRKTSDYSRVSFAEGDTLTFPEYVYYIYEDGQICRLNVFQTRGWWSDSYSISDAALAAIKAEVQEYLEAELAGQTSYTKTVNGITMEYQIESATVEITDISANVSVNEGDDVEGDYLLAVSYTAQYNYVTRIGASVYNSLVGLSDTLASQTSGNGSYIGSASLDLSAEVANLFVDVDNGDYSLTDTSLATNAGDNTKINQGTINGTFDSVDILGNPRIYYTTIDMGAFENQTARDSAISNVNGTSISLTVNTARDVVDSNDGATSFREALELGQRMASLGYDVSIDIASDYTIRVDNTLGPLTVSTPLTINANGATFDADNSGCGLVVASDGLVVVRNLIVTNGASFNGGGIKFESGDLVLDDCLIYNCQATSTGGGIYATSDGTLQIYNTTIARNVAVEGSGIYGAARSNVLLANSIVAGNRSSEIGETPCDAAFEGSLNLAFSLIENAGTKAYADELASHDESGNSKIGYGIDNALDAAFVNASAGNFRLSATESPARGAGSRDFVYSGAVDLAGNPVEGRSAVSMGAYQLGQETPSLVVTTLEDVVDPYDGLISLREAVSYSRYWGDNTGDAGAGKLYSSSYNAENAMSSSAYSATFAAPITFDASLAGGTIVLESSINFVTRGDGGQVYDYMIDASSLSGLGGITIDTTAINDAAFNVAGRWDAQNSIAYTSLLDLRNIHMVGAGGAAAAANTNAIITTRNCLFEGYQSALTADINPTTDNAGLLQIYNTTIVGSLTVSGLAQIHNSIVTGYVTGTYTTSGNYSQIHMYASMAVGGTGTRVSTDSLSIVGGSLNDLFVDYANGDYRLGDAALAINTGNNTYLRTLEATHAEAETDLNGNPRVYAGTVDMGCYERLNFNDAPSSVVTTLEDVVDPNDGEISIREALMYAQQGSSRFGNTVQFSEDLAGQTIKLDSSILLTRNVTFNGGENDITLDAGGNGSVFIINTGNARQSVPNVYLRNMTLTGGFTNTDGGAIYVQSGNAYFSGLEIWGNEANRYGGAIYAYDSELTINDCRIGGNKATYYGGVVNEFGKTVLTNSYVAQNTGVNVNAGADLWGRAVVNYVHSKNNVVGYVADNITLYNGVDNNVIGTIENPIKPFVNPEAGNLDILPEYAIDATASEIDGYFESFVDEESSDLEIELGSELSVFDDELFEEF